MNYFFLKQKDHKTPKGKLIILKSIEEIPNFIITNNYSGGYYFIEQRHSAIWGKTNMLILDIDEFQPNNKTISDVSKQLKSYTHIISPTKSHLKLKGRHNFEVCCCRYRLFLFLNDYICDLNAYKDLMRVCAEKLNLKPDKRALDATHFFYKSTHIHSVNTNGLLLDPHKLLEEKKKEAIETIINTKINSFQYQKSNEPIPDILVKWIQESQSEEFMTKKESFLRILMAQYGLLHRNELPQQFLADQIRVTRKTIRRWILELIKLRQLDYFSHYYYKGRAKQYRAFNELESSIFESKCKFLSKEKPTQKLPTSIKDGYWEEELIKAAWKFCNDSNSSRFYNWASSLPNFKGKPERERKVFRAWESVQKKKAEIQSHNNSPPIDA